MSGLFPFRPFVLKRDEPAALAIIAAYEARAKAKGLERRRLHEEFHESQRAALRAGMSSGEVISIVYDLQMHERAPARCRCGTCSPETAAMLATRKGRA
jgi:hypothetical protein